MQTQNETELTDVVLFSADLGEYDCERSLDELRALCEANGMRAVAEVVQKRDAPDKAFVLGEGRIAEGRELCQNLQAQTAVFDTELTGSQIRNLEQQLEVPVIDRTMLILEIFANRAVTGEGKLQTELARLQYRLPRLAGLGEALSRQGGGGAGGGGARRGAGESKLEYDKRYIRSRIAVMRDKLADMEKRREQTRKARRKNGVPVLALVGYTNVGKSSLLNALCHADVLQADMLFATLDPTARQLTLPSGLNAIAVDTVGFVSRLPHHLVQAFKSTLEEAAYADVIITVCDAADENAEQQLQVTQQVLTELGCAGIPQITVYNKCDKVPQAALFNREAVLTSAATGEGLDELLKKADELLAQRVCTVRVLLPFDKAALAVPMRQHGTVQCEEYFADGIYLEGICRAEDKYIYEPYAVEEKPQA